jgi:MoxR-like ATPase
MSDLIQTYNLCHRLLGNLEQRILGKKPILEKIVATFIAGGHILLEDVPGVGKTLLSKTLANSVHCEFKRIQFTNDLLPSDILGINIYNQPSNSFKFIQGPIFSNIILADEINRGSPKTQSALLEAMEEKQVTIDNVTYNLPELFFIIATQNDLQDSGTYHLPFAQLDRFWISLNLGYPDPKTEFDILEKKLNRKSLEKTEAITNSTEILQARKNLNQVFVSPKILSSVINFANKTRHESELIFGASTRSLIQLLQICRAVAVIDKRDYVTLDDVRSLASDVLCHRLGSQINVTDLI